MVPAVQPSEFPGLPSDHAFNKDESGSAEDAAEMKRRLLS